MCKVEGLVCIYLLDCFSISPQFDFNSCSLLLLRQFLYQFAYKSHNTRMRCTAGLRWLWMGSMEVTDPVDTITLTRLPKMCLNTDVGGAVCVICTARLLLVCFWRFFWDDVDTNFYVPPSAQLWCCSATSVFELLVNNMSTQLLFFSHLAMFTPGFFLCIIFRTLYADTDTSVTISFSNMC